MNDETGRIPETLGRLEQGLERIESEISQFRTDFMARLDQFERQVDAIHDRLQEWLDRQRAKEHDMDDEFGAAARHRTHLEAMDAQLRAWLNDT